MAAWILVGIVMNGLDIDARPLAIFTEQEDCREMRTHLLKQTVQPQINYELVCIKVDRKGA